MIGCLRSRRDYLPSHIQSPWLWRTHPHAHSVWRYLVSDARSSACPISVHQHDRLAMDCPTFNLKYCFMRTPIKVTCALIMFSLAVCIQGCHLEDKETTPERVDSVSDATDDTPDLDMHQDATPQCEREMIASCPVGSTCRVTDDSQGFACDCAEGQACKTCKDGFFLNSSAGLCERADACNARLCSGNGQCMGEDASPVCACQPGFTGADCSGCEAGYQGAGCQECLQGFFEDNGVCVGPSTCAAMKVLGATADGHYTLYVNGDATQPWSAWCHDMANTPVEYLTLAYTDNANSMFESYGQEDLKAQTRYFKVRLDPATLNVDITDTRFAHTISFDGRYNRFFSPPPSPFIPNDPALFGWVQSCSLSDSPAGKFSATGRINLLNTPFRRKRTQKFEAFGACPRTTFSEEGQIIELGTDGDSGQCSGIAPEALSERLGRSCQDNAVTANPNITLDDALGLEYAPGEFVDFNTVPATCAELKALNDVTTDGDQTLYYGRDSSKPWTAYCFGMTTSEPKEYLTLPEQGMDSNQFKNGSWHSGLLNETYVTRYQKVRLDPRTLRVDISDTQFATGSTTPAVAYATVGQCFGSKGRPGEGRVDLRNTPFHINDEFLDSGYLSSKEATTILSPRVAVLQVRGDCGTTGPRLLAERDGSSNGGGVESGRYNDEGRFLLQLSYPCPAGSSDDRGVCRIEP